MPAVTYVGDSMASWPTVAFLAAVAGNSVTCGAAFLAGKALAALASLMA